MAETPECNCESMGGRLGAHRPECPWQVAFEEQLAADTDRCPGWYDDDGFQWQCLLDRDHHGIDHLFAKEMFRKEIDG